MNLLQQIPRNALAWMVVCLFALVAPHVPRLPVWVLAVYVVAVVWRVMVYRGRWSFPGRATKVFLILSGTLGVYFSYGTFVGLEPTVALLLTAYALKFIELSQRKDAYVLLFLGYFICTTQFLFSQDLLITLYSLVEVLLITTALVALHQPGSHRFNRGSMRLATVMLLQAFPLMAVLFFLFPRIGPLWTVPIKSNIGKTGMSDFMQPGDVASLSQSDEVAFRVKFDGDIPPRSSLYWRGLVFSRLQQGTWSSLGHYAIPLEEQRPRPVKADGEPLTYSIIMEPTQQNWLYALRYARSSTPGVMHTSDFRVYSLTVLETEYIYQLRSWPDAQLDTELSDWRRATETTLPPRGNERSRQLAREMRAAADSDREFVDAVLAMFAEQPFVYTLRPGLLQGLNAMDQFLFETRRGFCEHYAAAFVIMMRAAGVPARVVAGYHGGEVNPVNRTVIVHQFDAHAWAEVWFQGQGWVRVDPTSAVSPTRIESGLEEAVAEEGSFLANAPLSPLRYRNIPLMNMLRLRYDALTYQWQSWVVGFNSEQQTELLRDVFGELSARKFAAALLGSWLLVMLPVAISLFRRRATRQLNPVDQLYLGFCERLAQVGVVRAPGEAPASLARRAQRELPAAAAQVREITDLYHEMAYARPSAMPEGRLEKLRRAVRGFKPNRRRPQL